ncbi:hypothetical protein V5O48_014386 [Marasmius crinis-equi]|uniref:Uncharacterized protein n=1 Tax=Marasmius crinis-equi TaxID=585013 RepID=A0ABR3EXI7_9AGAR
MLLPEVNPGRAGEQQWGLDVRIHQDSWDPYAYFPDIQGNVHHGWENHQLGGNTGVTLKKHSSNIKQHLSDPQVMSV